jgi:proline iminopeptidase
MDRTRSPFHVVNRKIYSLFEPIEPFDAGYMTVDSGHSLYYEQSGNPNGIPVLFLHGGPGAGASPVHRQFFDPDFWRVIIFDQRGAGRSRPLGSLENNTTQALIGDINHLLAQLAVQRALLFGGSWGSTLALAYAMHHPERVTGLVLRGIFLGRPQELEWFLYGIRNFYPDVWSAFTEQFSTSERKNLLQSYYARLTSPDETIRLPAARMWSVFEGSCSTLIPNRDLIADFASDRIAVGLARIEAHYFVHKLFLPDNYFFDQLPRIRHLPATIVQGRYDVVCPPVTAYELSQAWPEAQFVLVPDAGHSAFEAGTRSELVGAVERMKTVIR